MASGAEIKRRKEVLLEFMKDKDSSEIPEPCLNELMFIREYEKMVDDIRFFLKMVPLTMDKEKCFKHFHKQISYLRQTRYLKRNAESMLENGESQLKSLVLYTTKDYQKWLRNFCNDFILTWIKENQEK